jgi:hypothetical protein
MRMGRATFWATVIEPQRPALEEHAEAPVDLSPTLAGRRPIVLVAHAERPGGGPQETDHGLHQGALSRAAGAHHAEDGALGDGEREVVLDDPFREADG